MNKKELKITLKEAICSNFVTQFNDNTFKCVYFYVPIKDKSNAKTYHKYFTECKIKLLTESFIFNTSKTNTDLLVNIYKVIGNYLVNLKEQRSAVAPLIIKRKILQETIQKLKHKGYYVFVLDSVGISNSNKLELKKIGINKIISF